jgi:hypothetical protein
MPGARSTVGLRPSYKPVLKVNDMIVGFDPGVTTGVCVVQYLGGLDAFALTSVAEIPWSARFSAVQAVLAHADHIVVESFRLYASRAQDQINNSFPSAQVIGIIDTWAWMYNKYEKIVEQPASDIGRTVVLPQHLAAIGTGSEHKKDAYKHVRRFISRYYKLGA